MKLRVARLSFALSLLCAFSAAQSNKTGSTVSATSQPRSDVAVSSAQGTSNKTVTTPGGTANYIPLWTGATTIGNSVISQSAGNANVFGSLALSWAGLFIGYNLNPATGKTYDPNYYGYQVGHDILNNSFEIRQYGGDGTYLGMPLYARADGGVILVGSSAGNVGIGEEAPNYKLEVNGNVRIEGTNNGIVFPDGTVQITAAGTGGGGTITGVIAGTDLTGGGTSGAVTLNLDLAATDARYIQKGASQTLTTVAVNYTETTDLSCPGGYVVVVASCNVGANVVLNDEKTTLPPGVTSWANYLKPSVSDATGVHCNLGAAVQSQAQLRCAQQ